MAKKAKKISPIKNSKKQKSPSRDRHPRIKNALNRMWDTVEDIQDCVLSDEIATMTLADIEFVNMVLGVAKVCVSGTLAASANRLKKDPPK